MVSRILLRGFLTSSVIVSALFFSLSFLLSIFEFMPIISHQWPPLDESGRQPQDVAQSLVQNQPSLLALASLPSHPSPFCLPASRQSEPSIVSASKLQNSIRRTFQVDSWVDLSFPAQRKWIKPISSSSSYTSLMILNFTDVVMVISQSLFEVCCCVSQLTLSALFLSSDVLHLAPVSQEMFGPHLSLMFNLNLFFSCHLCRETT